MMVLSWCVLVVHVPLEPLPISDLPCPLENMMEGQWIYGGCLWPAAGWALLRVWRNKDGIHQQNKVLLLQAGTSYRTSTRKCVLGKI